MAKAITGTPKKRAKPTREVSVPAVMLHARAIIEQGRTQEFLEACKKSDFSMRGTSAFLLFAREFARARTSLASESAGTDKFTKAVVEKNCDDLTKP